MNLVNVEIEPVVPAARQGEAAQGSVGPNPDIPMRPINEEMEPVVPAARPDDSPR